MVDDAGRYHALYEMAITDAIPAQVTFATNGEAALELIHGPDSYDLMILDLNMPQLGGEATLARIRALPDFDGMPIIILTGDPDPNTQQRLLEAGADDFIEKGSPPELFVARLQAQMRYKLGLNALTALAVDLDIFAAGVLHDIRGIETNLITLCDLAAIYLESDPEKHREQLIADVELLAGQAQRLGTYAADIIAMVRQRRADPELKPVDIEPLVAWVGKLVMPGKLSGEHRSLELNIEGETYKVAADRNYLQLALLNLVQNAVKYARIDADPKVTITQRLAGGGHLVVTRLIDNGVGIPEQERRRIFEPFERGQATTGQQGFGLGLSLVARVMQAMHGRVWAEAPPAGQSGAIVCLELPLASRNSAPTPAEEQP